MKKDHWLTLGEKTLLKGHRALAQGKPLRADHAEDLLYMAVCSPGDTKAHEDQKKEAELLCVTLVEDKLLTPTAENFKMLAAYAAPTGGPRTDNAATIDAARFLVRQLTPHQPNLAHRYVTEPMMRGASLGATVEFRMAATELLGDIVCVSAQDAPRATLRRLAGDPQQLIATAARTALEKSVPRAEASPHAPAAAARAALEHNAPVAKPAPVTVPTAPPRAHVQPREIDVYRRRPVSLGLN